MSQIERLYWIDRQIRDRRYPNAETISNEFRVSCRTAYEDRRHLIKDLGAPIKTDHRRGGWYYSNPTFMLPFLAFSRHEADTLRRSLLTAQAYLTPPDAALVHTLAQRLQPLLPTLAETTAESIGGAIPLDVAGDAPPALLNQCRQGIAERRRLHLVYHAAHTDTVTKRLVQPYHLLYWRGEPYLIAWCELRHAFRDFFLGRIRQWKLLSTPDAFVRDPAFDADAYLQHGFALRHGEALVTVRMRFSAYQARWVRERRYHPSQQATELADGCLELILHVAGTAEIKRWLLGYGPEVEVMEPPSLRRELAEDAKKLWKIYAAPQE